MVEENYFEVKKTDITMIQRIEKQLAQFGMFFLHG